LASVHSLNFPLNILGFIDAGSGLHTFVLYLGPHIAIFTLRATQCGRVDLKSAPYDTIQLNRAPSWIDKSCSDFGSPLFPQLIDSERFRTPLLSILPQVQLEAILWGIGTAIGELPPYFVSRAGIQRLLLLTNSYISLEFVFFPQRWQKNIL
jgi:hypothetical protein